jgi:hypothetical protein
MFNKLNKSYLGAGLLTAAVMISLGSCQKDFRNNGLETALTPSFTIEPIAGRTNTYLVKNTTAGAMNTRWDFDNGAGFGLGKYIDTVFFPDAGVYNVKMQSMGKGGIYYDAAAKAVTIATSDPNAGNLVQGGKMNAADASKWTIHPISAGVNMELKDGKMLATGGGWGHAAFWQKLDVVAGKKYRFAMTIAGSGATNTWLEVYFGSVAPVAGSDYNNGGIRIAMNTWAGCGGTAFSGNIAVIGCDGALVGKNGEVTFASTGSIYLFVKTGGEVIGTTGITFDNVELRGT